MEKTQEPSQKGIPKKLDFSLVARVSEDCNIRCKYCYLDSYSKRNMSSETADMLIKEFMRYNDNFAHFTWIGGEPLIREDSFFQEIMDSSKKHNIKNLRVSHSIQTNGLYSPGRFDTLKKMGFKIGISYDGAPDLQAFHRVGGKNAEKIIENIYQTKRNAGIISVLTKKSIGREKEIYDFFKENTTFARVNLFAPTGKGLAHEKELIPSIEEAKSMLLNFYSLWREDNSPLELRPHREIVRSFFTGFPVNCEYSAVSCYKIFGSDSKGDIYTCSRSIHIPEMKLGHISEGLDKLVDSKPHQKILERYLYLKEKSNSPYFHISCGGCPVEAYSHTGDMMNLAFFSGEPRDALFREIEKDLKNDAKRKKLERKAGII